MDDIPQLQEQWERDWRKPNEEVRAFAKHVKGTLAQRNGAPRVNQLDAIVLDTQVEELLSTRLLRSLSSEQGGGAIPDELIDSYRPEITAILRAAIWISTVARRAGTTYGQDLQNVSPGSPLSPVRSVIHLCLSVALPWAASRAQREMTSRRWWEMPHNDWKWLAWKALYTAETVAQVAVLVNFLVFLYRGDHPTLASRLVFPAIASLCADAVAEPGPRVEHWRKHNLAGSASSRGSISRAKPNVVLANEAKHTQDARDVPRSANDNEGTRGGGSNVLVHTTNKLKKSTDGRRGVKVVKECRMHRALCLRKALAEAALAWSPAVQNV